MRRLWDESVNYAIYETVEPIAPVFELLTHLGDGAFLVALGVTMYWFGDSSRSNERIFVLAVGIAAITLAVGIKGIVQLPRPELTFAVTGYPGYSFPSAHALGAASVFSALAVTMRSGTPWIRYAFASLLIGIVAFSRIVIGVHYVGDVLVGVILGIAIVLIGLYVRRESEFTPGPIFVLAALIAIVTIFLGSREYVALAIGSSLGGASGWWWMHGKATTDRGAAILALGSVLLFSLLLAQWIFVSIRDIVPGIGPESILFVGEIITFWILTTMVLILPVLACKIDDHPLILRLQKRLPFRGRRIILSSPIIWR